MTSKRKETFTGSLEAVKLLGAELASTERRLRKLGEESRIAAYEAEVRKAELQLRAARAEFGSGAKSLPGLWQMRNRTLKAFELANTAWGRQALKRPPAEWAAAVNAISDLETRVRVASLVWWDWLSLRPATEPHGHLDALRDKWADVNAPVAELEADWAAKRQLVADASAKDTLTEEEAKALAKLKKSANAARLAYRKEAKRVEVLVEAGLLQAGYIPRLAEVRSKFPADSAVDAAPEEA